MTDPKERFLTWLSSPLVDEATKEELRQIEGDAQEITERFYRRLDFGTAGLRGILGAGDNRMNVYTVRQATHGLARHLCKSQAEPSVCIAYDSRRCSALFARETACVLSTYGIRVYLYETLHSVPQLSFTIRHLGCSAGVVITASHNPAKYNGYKVYAAHGGQVRPETADAIMHEILDVEDFSSVSLSYDAAVAAGKIVLIGQDVDEAYYASIRTLLLHPDLLKTDGGALSIVYTPLHGTGYVPVTEILRRIGVQNVAVVPEQAMPDGAFPTVLAPNPEDPKAFALAMPLAESRHANVILASDPDADRLGVAVLGGDGSWRVLTGNQIACLLLYYILSERAAMGSLPDNGLVVRSFVSTHLADAIAAAYGTEMAEVMTGFRFISEQIDRCEQTGEHTFLFGFEESYGYLAGGFSRDKDAILSAMLLSEACVVYHLRGLSLFDVLEQIDRRFGSYRETGISFTLEGKAGLERIASVMSDLRAAPPAELGGISVVRVEDFSVAGSTGLPRANALRYTLEGGDWVTVRPSGTEPKLKLYVGVRGDSPDEADARRGRLSSALRASIGALLKE